MPQFHQNGLRIGGAEIIELLGDGQFGQTVAQVDFALLIFEPFNEVDDLLPVGKFILCRQGQGRF